MKLTITIEHGVVEINVDGASISLAHSQAVADTSNPAHRVRPHAIADLFECLGGNSSVARSLGLGPSSVSEMKRRNSVLPRYWPALICLAQERGVPGITADHLMVLHSIADANEVSD